MCKDEKNGRGKSFEQDSNDDLPFPDSDISPALQRTIKRKLEEGEDVEGDPEEMEKIIKKMTKNKKKRDTK